MALTAAREKGRFDWQAMRVQVKLGDKQRSCWHCTAGALQWICL